MKKIFFFLLLSATFSLIGCGNDGEDDDVVTDFMTATIDGNGFTATTINGFADNTFGEELLLINGTQASNSAAIGLNWPTSLGTGSFDVDADDLSITFTDDILNGEDAFFTVGTLNIIRNDTTANVLEGTFNFTATDDDDATNVFEITNGAFKVTYL